MLADIFELRGTIILDEYRLRSRNALLNEMLFLKILTFNNQLGRASILVLGTSRQFGFVSVP